MTTVEKGDYSPQKPEIVVTGRKITHTKIGYTITVTYAWWNGFPYRIGPDIGSFTYTEPNGFCGKPVDWNKVEMSALQSAAGGSMFKAAMRATKSAAVGAAAGTLVEPGGGSIVGAIGGFVRDSLIGAAAGGGKSVATQACL